MKIVLSEERVSTPKIWSNFINLIPQINNKLFYSFIKNNNFLLSFVNNLSFKCPFERAYFLTLNSKKFLVYYVPALCKLNPFYNLIIDLKMSGLTVTTEVIEIKSVFELIKKGEP